MTEKCQKSVLLYLLMLSVALIYEAESIFLSCQNDVLLSIMSSKASGVYETAAKEALQGLQIWIGNHDAMTCGSRRWLLNFW
jgi:hypothetical protein